MALDILFLVRTLVFPGLAFLLVLVLFFDWFERKVAARFQNRMGPSYAGPFGILQPVADYIKLFSKEDITPGQTNKVLFVVAPLLAFSLFVFALFFIPVFLRSVFPHEQSFGRFIMGCVIGTVSLFIYIKPIAGIFRSPRTF